MSEATPRRRSDRSARIRRLAVGIGVTPMLLGGGLILTDTIGASISGAAPTATEAEPKALPPVASSPVQAEAAFEYWTPEKMAAAKPAPMPEISSSSAQESSATAAPDGPPVVAGGFNPVTGGSAEVPAGIAGSTSSVEPTGSTYPSPFDRWQYFAKYRRYPISTIAKIFYRASDGGNYSCTAATIGSSTELDTVFTAGHCVSDGAGTFHTNMLVCPSYDNGVHPQVGCWSGVQLATSSEWHNTGNFDRDYGAIRTATSGTVHNNHITSINGALGWAFNFPRDQHWMDFGYPGDTCGGCNGQKIIVCATEYSRALNLGSGADSNDVGCDMGRGSSGGPWIKSFTGNGGFINSVNSNKNFGSEPLHLRGPYFDTQVSDFLTFVFSLS